MVNHILNIYLRSGRIWTIIMSRLNQLPSNSVLIDSIQYLEYRYITNYYVCDKVIYVVDTYLKDNHSDISMVTVV